MADAQILVLGGGVSGCLTAAYLTDHGVRVAIVEQHGQLMSAASRWNDGKIHLGYTFAGAPSPATARLLLAGSATFIEGLERALGETLPDQWFGNGVTYLVDAGSMVDAETLWQRTQRVARLHSEMAERHPGLRRYLDGQLPLERLPLDQAEAETRQSGIIAAWRTPERHISSVSVADRLAEAVSARSIDIIQGRVVGVAASSSGWRVSLSDGHSLVAPIVVNCLWEGRAMLDRDLCPSTEPTSIRYKRALFGAGVTNLAGLASSTRILGPYGDIAIYANGHAYLSWYPAGLVARSDSGIPPAVPEPDDGLVTHATLAGLGLAAEVLEDPGSKWQVQGGFIVAWGHGDIDKPDSPLHERHRPGVFEVAPGFISVDTGKYTLGPLLAERATERVLKVLASRLGPPSNVDGASERQLNGSPWPG